MVEGAYSSEGAQSHNQKVPGSTFLVWDVDLLAIIMEMLDRAARCSLTDDPIHLLEDGKHNISTLELRKKFGPLNYVGLSKCLIQHCTFLLVFDSLPCNICSILLSKFGML